MGKRLPFERNAIPWPVGKWLGKWQRPRPTANFFPPVQPSGDLPWIGLPVAPLSMNRSPARIGQFCASRPGDPQSIRTAPPEVREACRLPEVCRFVSDVGRLALDGPVGQASADEPASISATARALAGEDWSWKRNYPLNVAVKKRAPFAPQEVSDQLAALARKAFIRPPTDVGQHQMWAAAVPHNPPRHWNQQRQSGHDWDLACGGPLGVQVPIR